MLRSWIIQQRDVHITRCPNNRIERDPGCLQSIVSISSSLLVCRFLSSHTTSATQRLVVLPQSHACAHFGCLRLDLNFSAELLSAYEYWVYGWGWNNLAVIVGEYFDHIECPTRAVGRDFRGWDCVFRPMPHICTFRDLDVSLSYLLLEKEGLEKAQGRLHSMLVGQQLVP